MSDTLTRLASKLADDTMDAMAETGNDRLFMEIAQVIGEASQTLEEAYLTEVRVRLAEIKGRDFLETIVTAHREGKDGPGTQLDADI